MKRLMITAMILAAAMSVYSCSTKCVSNPPPGGYSYDEPVAKGGQGEKR